MSRLDPVVRAEEHRQPGREWPPRGVGERLGHHAFVAGFEVPPRSKWRR